MRHALMSTIVSAALFAGTPSITVAGDNALLVIGTDNSDSFSLFVNTAIARSAGNTVERLVEDMEPGDRVRVLSFGLAGVATRQINIEVEIGRKARTRPNRVADALGAFMQSLPERVARGEIEVQSRTNIIGFIEGLAPSLDCETAPTHILLFTDGIEWSTQVRGDELLSGRADLPAPSGPILKGCVIEMRGLGQQTTELGTDSRWFPLLRDQWSAFFAAARAASFTAYAEFQ